MCNCPLGGEPLEASTPRPNDELSPQDEEGRRRQRVPCCKAKRTLTYEDETPANVQGPPGPPGAPQRNAIPPLRRCELVGVAIVRRRIDFDASPGKTADGEEKPPEEGEGEAGDKEKPPEEGEGEAEDTENPEDAGEAEKDKAEEAEEPNAGESSGSTPEKDKNGEKPANGNGATPPGCPGQSDPEKDCTCPPKSQS